jgi:hypothetical protein
MDVLIYQVCSNCDQYLGSPPTPMMQRRPVSAIYSQARMIKVYINLFEEEYKCVQVRKHKAAHEIKIKIKTEGECKCAQVRKYKAAHDKSININLFEEEYKCAQVRKHKAAQDEKYLSEEECKCAQVRRHKAAHEIIIIIIIKSEEECKCAQVRKHKAAHDKLYQ